MIELLSVGDAPRIRVTGPNGQSAESPAGSDVVASGAIRNIRSKESGLTVVGLQDAPPGACRIERIPGSPAITRVRHAEGKPPAKITARVQGSQSAPTLISDVAPGDAPGKPMPGRSARTIFAQFQLNDRATERLTVARVAPPPPLARPARLRVCATAAACGPPWGGVLGATAYEFVTTAAGGA